MDAPRFDALTRGLSTGNTRRGLLGLLLTLPVIGGLLAFLGIEETEAKGRRKRRKKRHKHGKGNGRRRKGKRNKKRCKRKSRAKICANRCGIVKNRQTCQKKVDCGPCVCDPPCAPGLVCQANGACACDAGSCNGTTPICDEGSCVACSAARPCATGCCAADGSCQPGTTGDFCGAGGATCRSCSATERCADGGCQPCVCGGSDCPNTSVQAAINAASDGAVITICAGLYQEGAPISIGKSLTLRGAGDGDDPLADTILDGQEQHRVVAVGSGVTGVRLEGLRLTGGSDMFEGAGLINSGELTLSGCTLSGNSAGIIGGGLTNDASGRLILANCTVDGNSAGSAGGGIVNEGTLSLTDSTVSGNHALENGGGLYNGDRVSLINSTVRGNEAGQNGGDGGGIHNVFGTLTLTNSTVSGNNTTVGAGGTGAGINIASGTLILTDSTVRDNHAAGIVGGIHNDGGTVSLRGGNHVCENTPNDCFGFTPPVGVCTEDCPP